MPSSYDLRPVQITHDPTQRIDSTPGKLPLPSPLDFTPMLGMLFDRIKDYVGIDLSSPDKFIGSIVSIVTGGGSGQTNFANMILSLFGSATGVGDVFSWVGKIPLLSGGLLSGSIIPGLDASKIISGSFPMERVTGLLDALAHGDVAGIVKALTGIDGGNLIDLGNWSKLVPLLSGGLIPGGLIPGLDASKIISGLFPAGLIPSLDASKIGSGTFLSGLIPGLDAGKIVSGIFGGGLIPSLDASKIGSGTFLTSLIPNLPASIINSGTLLSSLIPGLDASKITSGSFSLAQLPTTVLTSVSGVASSLINGVLGLGNIPGLPASQVTSGTFLGSLIPGLDASKITSGLFPQSMLSITNIAAGIVSGALSLANIPNLPASILTSGTLGGGLIPSLDASKIGSGVFGAGLIPNLDAGKIVSGALDLLRIPSLPASQIGSGTFASGLLPLLDGSKIGSGVVSSAFLPSAPWFASIPSALLSGNITAPVQAAVDIVDTLANAVKNATGGGTLTDVLTGFLSLGQQNKASAQALAALQTSTAVNQSNVPPGGLNRAITFAGADGSALAAADFSASGPTSGDVVVRSSNQLGVRAANGLGVYFATINALFTSDDQALEFVLGGEGSYNGAGTYHLFHADSGCTVGAYARTVNDSVTLGSFTRSGSTWTFTPFSGGSWSGAFGAGSRVRVRNVGTTYYVDLNANNVFSVTNSSVTFGAARRYGHVGVERAYSQGGFFGWQSGTYDSFRVASILASDFVSTTIVGSGAELVRTNTANYSVPTGTARFPDSFWQASKNVSADLRADPATGRIYVTKTKYYDITFRLEVASSNVPTRMTLFRGSAGGGSSLDKRIGSSMASDSNPGALEGTTKILLNAGEYVELGYIKSGGMTTLTATNDGLSSYLTVLGAG